MNRSEIERIDRITAAVHYLLKGENPGLIPCRDDPDDEIQQLSNKVNELMRSLEEVREFAIPLSHGNLDVNLPRHNLIGAPFKQLQASLKHLTWQTRQIAQGDFNQRVRFMGDFSNAFNTMVEALDEARIQLMDEIARAENLAELKSQYLNVMAHDIRTPINAIIGFAEILLESGLTEEQRESIIIVQRSSEALIALINNILDLAKLEKGKMEVESIPYSIQSLGVDIGALIASKLNEGVHYLFELDDGIPEQIVGDPNRLRQVLINLVGNAAKFTETGTITFRVEAMQKDNAGFDLRFSVIDTGMGIPEERLDRIFTPFTQADSSVASKFGGTGLGLNIALELVELMGGKLEVSSEVDCGTTFYFTIPAKEATGNEEISLQGHGQKENPFDESSLAEARILVVDDNPINRFLLRRLLERLSITVEEAENGEEGVEAAASGNFDAVFIDQMMPGMDGIEATRRIRQLPGGDVLPIVAFTADESDETRTLMSEAGVNGIVYKPIRKESVIQELCEAMADAEKTCQV